ncbi:MAG: hypothetical protein ACOX1F_03090 [Erysipelotrichaceae bacterium]|jgi:hypothetical protein
MQRIKEFFTQLINRFLESVRRFLLTNIFLAFITLVLVISIIIDNLSDPYQYLLLAATLGGLTSFVLTLADEKYRITNGKIINIIVSLSVTIATYIVFHFFSENDYVFLGYIGLLLVEMCISFYLLFFIEDNKKLFASLLCSLLYCHVMITTIVLGLSVCLLAFETLIYRFDNFERLYLIAGAIFEVFVANSLFLSYIPTRDEKLSVSRAYENILHKAALTVYYLLIGILYIYLAKVLITFELPINKINWFASFALLFYCLFYLSCHYAEKGIGLFHLKYGGFLMLPIMLVQNYVLFLRISAYGLTTPRYLSVMFNLIALAFIISSFFKKGAKPVFLFIAAVVAVLSIGPFNMIDVPFNSQSKRMEKILLKNGMLDGKTIVANPDISEEDKREIREIYNYLQRSASKKENYITDIFDSEFETVFGFKRSAEEETVKEDYINCDYYNSYEVFDIEGYRSMEYIDYGCSVEIAGYNIENYFWSLYNTYGKSQTTSLVYTTEDGTRIIFGRIFFSVVDKTEIREVDYNCFILRK